MVRTADKSKQSFKGLTLAGCSVLSARLVGTNQWTQSGKSPHTQCGSDQGLGCAVAFLLPSIDAIVGRYHEMSRYEMRGCHEDLARAGSPENMQSSLVGGAVICLLTDAALLLPTVSSGSFLLIKTCNLLTSKDILDCDPNARLRGRLDLVQVYQAKEALPQRQRKNV